MDHAERKMLTRLVACDMTHTPMKTHRLWTLESEMVTLRSLADQGLAKREDGRFTSRWIITFMGLAKHRALHTQAVENYRAALAAFHAGAPDKGNA